MLAFVSTNESFKKKYNNYIDTFGIISSNLLMAFNTRLSSVDSAGLKSVFLGGLFKSESKQDYYLKNLFSVLQLFPLFYFPFFFPLFVSFLLFSINLARGLPVWILLIFSYFFLWLSFSFINSFFIFWVCAITFSPSSWVRYPLTIEDITFPPKTYFSCVSRISTCSSFTTIQVYMFLNLLYDFLCSPQGFLLLFVCHVSFPKYGLIVAILFQFFKLAAW